MIQSARSPWPSQFPWGLVGMLGLIWGIEGLVEQRVGPLYSLLACDWATTAGAVGREAPGCDLLCLGDSQIKLGVQVVEIERRLGVRAYNLALNRGLPASSEFLLRRAIEAGARPKAIVLGASPGLLTASPTLNGPLWPELVGPSEILEVSWKARDPRPALQAIARLALPSNNARDEIQSSILAAFRGESNASMARTLQFRQNWQRHRGAQAHPKNLGFVDPLDDPSAGDLSASWRPRPENLAHLRALLTLAAEHQIQVYWLAQGFSPAVQARRERNGLDEAYTRFLEGLRAEFPTLVILDARRLRLDASLYIDPVHLDLEGAKILSAFLAEAIGPAFNLDLDLDHNSPSPWIDLAKLDVSDLQDLASRRGLEPTR